jgi:hypothetical protein
MFRLSVLLCAAIFTTLLIAGEDKGQLRPGLARAVAAGEEIVIVERRRAPELPVVEVEPGVAIASVAETPVAEPAAYVPPPVAEPVRKVTPEPVFTLSTLPTVAADPVEAPVVEVAEPTPAMSGNIWYVTANSVNVREGPSTDTSIVDKLVRGEAVAVSFEEGSEWAYVSIEGDGLEGYVALRFLSPDAP